MTTQLTPNNVSEGQSPKRHLPVADFPIDGQRQLVGHEFGHRSPNTVFDSQWTSQPQHRDLKDTIVHCKSYCAYEAYKHTHTGGTAVREVNIFIGIHKTKYLLWKRAIVQQFCLPDFVCIPH